MKPDITQNCHLKPNQNKKPNQKTPAEEKEQPQNANPIKPSNPVCGSLSRLAEAMEGPVLLCAAPLVLSLTRSVEAWADWDGSLI